MGIFGGSKVYVGTSVVRMIEDELLPNIRVTSPIKAILSNASMPGTIVDDILSGVGKKVDSGFKYARDGDYYYGLPNQTFNNTLSGTPQFLPYVFFRSRDVNVTDPSLHSTPQYITSKKLMRKFGIDYQDMGDAIHDNEDINDIEDAVMTFSIPVNTESEMGKTYLYEFFNWFVTTSPNLVLIPKTDFGDNYNHIDMLSQVTVDEDRYISLEDGTFKMALYYGGVSSNVIPLVMTGTDTRVQTYIRNVEQEYWRWESSDGEKELVKKIRNVDVVTYRFLRKLNSSQAHEIYVSSLGIIYSVRGDDVEIDAEPDEGRVLIPLNYALVNATFNLLDRDTFYAESMHLVFNSRVKVNIPWYQSGFFRAILFIAAFVITVISIGQAAPATAAAWATLAGTYGVVVATIILALKFIAIQAIMDVGFKFAADKLGDEVALMLAVISAAIGVYGQSGNKAWAENLMKYSTNLARAANSNMADKAAGVLSEIEEFQTEAERLTAELEEAQSELEPTTNIDLYEMLYLEPMFIEGETASDFYDRTINTSNIGTMAFDYIHHYVDASLRLPTIEDTMDFNKNG